MLQQVLSSLLAATLLYDVAWGSPIHDDRQYTFDASSVAVEDGSRPQKLHGRFLQITDMHPDIYYKPGSSREKACHSKKPKKKRNRAGYYGAPYSDCDSPMRLIDMTFQTLEDNWVDEIDFVVWTGDNARHDNDRHHPRTTQEIYDLNRLIANKMERTFTRRGIPVVPSIGRLQGITMYGLMFVLFASPSYSPANSQRQNILDAGPNDMIDRLSKAWSTFIPFPQRQVFQRGGYYSLEVIPQSVAVIALNTMYFYDSNKAVGGCQFKDPADPGNLQYDWLEVQLKAYRRRGMQVWLTGHVPPSSGNFYPECYVRYVELSLRYQDTILGHLYGHMNADHFFFIQLEDLMLDGKEKKVSTNGNHADLYETLLDEFAELPKSKKLDEDDFGVVNVSPPVVPNPYLPSFRVFSYNVSDSGGQYRRNRRDREAAVEMNKPSAEGRFSKCKEKEHRDTWRCHLNQTWHSDPTAPSRMNQLWTPLGYAQYIIPQQQLKKASKTHVPTFELEYATYQPTALVPPEDNSTVSVGGQGEGVFQYPIPRQNLPKALANGPVKKSKYLPYKMPDLTVGSWLHVAKKLGDPAKSKLRQKFQRYMYLGATEEG